MNNLGKTEIFILLALWHLGKGTNAYGMTIRRDVADRMKKDISIGAVYMILDRLERSGLVKSQKGESTPERGGRAKRYFELTACGEKELRQTKSIFDEAWGDLAPIGA